MKKEPKLLSNLIFNQSLPDVSSIIYEGIGEVSILLIFFYKEILHAKKA